MQDQSNEKTAEMSSSNVPKASQSDAPGGLDPLGLCVVSVPHGSRTASASKKDINTSDSSACELTKPASADPAISSLVASTASSSVENTQSSTAVHNKASSKQYPWSVPTQQQDTFDFTQTQVPMSEPPGPRASSEEKMDFLQQQLDSFGLDRPIFDDLLLLGSGGQQRRQGGVFYRYFTSSSEVGLCLFYIMLSCYRGRHMTPPVSLKKSAFGLQGRQLFRWQ